MRELKFRAWTKSRMIYRSFHNRDWYTLDGRYVMAAMPEDKGSLEIMQYTGLKDKNGVEIYEGDVVVGRNYEDEAGEPREVEWSDNGYHGNNLPLWAINRVEVIGNIYENPGLLEPDRSDDE